MDVMDSHIGGPITAVSTAPGSASHYPRRRFVLGAAAFLGVAATAGCAAPDRQTCYEERRSGQKGRVLAAVPCPGEAE